MASPPITLPDMTVSMDATSSPAGTSRPDATAAKESTWTVHGGNVFGDLVSQSIKSALMPDKDQGSSRSRSLMKAPASKKQRPASVHGATNFAANNFQSSPVMVSPTIGRRTPGSPARGEKSPPRRAKHRRTPSRELGKAHFTRDYSKWDAAAAHRAAERWLQYEENSKHDGECFAPPPEPATGWGDRLQPAGGSGGVGSSGGGSATKVELTDFALGDCLGMGAFATVHAPR